MPHYCTFCQMEHSSASCYHPGRAQVADHTACDHRAATLEGELKEASRLAKKEADVYRKSVEDRDRLERELGESNAVCICGCPVHESYGEDGESCGVDSHDCIRVSASAATLYAKLQQEVERLREVMRHAQNRLELSSTLGSKEVKKFYGTVAKMLKGALAADREG